MTPRARVVCSLLFPVFATGLVWYFVKVAFWRGQDAGLAWLRRGQQ